MLLFPDPRGWWLVGIALLFVLTLWLRRRTRTVRVTAFFLLREAAAHLARLSPRVRLRRQLRLLLLLAAVAAIVVAGFQPRYRSRRAPLRVLALVDLSPSLGVLEGGRRRLQVLREQLDLFAAQLQPEDAVAVVLADSQPTATPFLPGDTALRDMARSLDFEDAPADAGRALRLVDALLTPGPCDRLLVFTDSPARWREGFGVPERSAPAPHFVTFGLPVENAGVTAFELRGDPFQPGVYNLFLRVLAARPRRDGPPGTRVLEVGNNGRVVRRIPLTAPPGEEQEVLLRGLQLEPGRVDARLDPPDAYPADDAATAGVAETRQVRVQLHSVGNRYLREALAANPAVSLRAFEFGETAPADPGAVSVFDGDVPAGELPARALFIQPNRELPGIVSGSYQTAPQRVDWDRTDPVLQGVDLEGFVIPGFQALEHGASFRSAATADGHPLLLLGDEGGRRWAVLAFDPAQTNFVYDASYPILIANLVRWLALFAPGERTALAIGDPVVLPAAAGGGAVLLPSGEREALVSHGPAGVIFPGNRHPGRYRVVAAGGAELGEFHVNVLDAAVTAGIARGVYGGVAPRLPAGLRRGPLGIALLHGLILLALALLAAERLSQRPPRSERE